MRIFYKVMSTFLSVTLVLTSVTPSFAQIHNTSRKSGSHFSHFNTNISPSFSTQIERDIHTQTVENRLSVTEQAAILQEMEEIVRAAEQDRSDNEQEITNPKTLLPMEDFVRFYKDANKETLNDALAQCSNEEERSYVRQQWDKLTSQTALASKYNQALAELQKEIDNEEKEVKKHLRYLSEQAVLWESSFHPNGKAFNSIDPINQFLPLMVSFGEEVLTKDTRMKAASLLRQRLQERGTKEACKDENSCSRILRNTVALSVLGTQKQDVETMAEVFVANYNGPAAASMIPVLGSLLLAMRDIDPTYEGFGKAMESVLEKKEAQANSYSKAVGEVLAGVFSVKTYVDLGTKLTGTFGTEEYETSFYKQDKYKSLGNAWIDLGKAVAQESASDPALKRRIDALLNGPLMDANTSYGKGEFNVRFHHTLFLTGLLSGGYKMNVQGHPAQTYFITKGVRPPQSVDTRGAWAHFTKSAQAVHLTQSEATALILFKADKAALDPYTAVYINNELTNAFNRKERTAQSAGLQKRKGPSAQEISRYNEWQANSKAAAKLDTIITIASIVFLAKVALTALPRVIGSGAQAIRTIARSARIARAAQAANIARLSSLRRVLRTARFYKYGTYSHGRIFLQNARTSLGASLGYRINMNELMPLKKPYVRPTATGTPSATAGASTGVEVAALDSKTLQLIPEGSAGRSVNLGSVSSAPETFASQGEGFANAAKVQPLSAPQKVAPAPSASSQTTVSSAKNTPYIRGKVTNSIGQEVEAWVPNPDYVAQYVPTNPVRKFSWLDNMRLQWELNVKPTFSHLFQFGKSRYGLAAMVPGVAPVSSEAAISQALLRDVPALVRPIQLERSMFISENALRVGATGTRMTTSNLGGLASQGFARASANVATQTAINTVANPGTGQLVAEVARPLTRGNRFWSRVVAMVPGLGFANSWATPKVDKIPFTYQKVWFNTKTQTVEYAHNTKEIPNGFKVFTVSFTPLFIAQPEIDQQALDAIANKLTEDAEKEARQTGEPVNRKVLRARIEKEQNNLPAAIAIRKANLIAQYILGSQQAQREDLVWVLASNASPSYKIQANQKMQQLYMKPVTLQELLVKRMNLQRQVNLKVSLKKDELSDIAEKVSGRLLQENLGQLVPQDDPLLSQGLTWRELTNVDQDRLTEALYPQENIEDLLRYSTHENFFGNTEYDKVLPVYVRDVMGDVGEKPQLYLLLNKPFIMPRGFRVVIDESGHFKFASYNLRAVSTSRKPYNRVLKRIYKWQPNFLDKLWWVKNNPRRLQEWDSSARRLVFETPLKASELTALNYILSNRPGQVAVLPTAPNDTFEPLMTWTVPIVAGADLGASLSSQLKKTLTSEAAITGTSGGGFASPWAANFFSPLINKYGYYRALQVGFLTMLVLSAIGMTAGLWIPEVAQLLATLSGSEELMEKALKLTVSESSMLGMFKPGASNVHLGLSLIWMSAAMVTASVFSMLAGPILKSTYTDPTIFSSKNMEFTTNKGFSRMLVASGLGAILKIVKGIWGIDLNWSILVPAMFVLGGVGLVQLRGSRLYKEHQALQREKAQMKEDVNLSTQETKQKAEFEKAQARQFAAKMKEKYATTFAKPLKSVTNRLGLIYLTYGNVNSVILGMLAGILYSSSTALFISAAGYFASWLVRKAADRLIKSRVITEDQLTGMSLPLMLAGVATGLVAPFGSVSMAAFFALMYLSTPTFGVSENTRMMNYIASYYKAQREQVNKNENLSITEKEEQLKAFNKEQEAMKVAAAVSYNNHNSMGIFPILATTALVAVTKDSWLGTAVSQQMSEWVKYAADMLRIGTDAAAYDIKKAAGAPLDFAIYRLALLPAVAFGMILNWTNVGMIKQGIKRLFSSIAVSKQDIADVEHSDILSDLQIDFRNINSTIEEISREVEELDAAIRPFKGSRTAEERLQGWANRMVWVNNRLKAITQAKPILLNRLKPEMRTMRELSKNFMLLLNYNDVSDALRQQGAALYQSLGFMQIEGEPYSTAKERFAKLIDSLATQTLSEEQKDLVVKIKTALDENNISQFPFLVRNLALGVSGNIKQGLMQTGREVEDEMTLSTLNLDNPGLQYLPELKLSALDALRHQLRIGKDPAKGIFAGADVDGYEQAKLLLREMRTMTKEATDGIITDGMFEQFNSFYNKAINYLQEYVQTNMARGQSEKMDSRVMVLKQEMDELYRQYLNKEPPDVKFALQPNLEAVEEAQMAPAY